LGDVFTCKVVFERPEKDMRVHLIEGIGKEKQINRFNCFYNKIKGMDSPDLGSAELKKRRIQRFNDRNRPAPELGKSLAHVTFAFDQSKLNTRAIHVLDSLVGGLSNRTLEELVIVGHTDNVGTAHYNQELGLLRAKSVQQYLNARTALPTRLEMNSEGEQAPVASNDSNRGRASNRRVEIKLVSRQALQQMASF
jgi:outer membrane protein OmpA-like peptidoglycan-associated protein